ncbi:uncharacterized protein Dwil_GK15983 [Drosophila willistoni]|uniref:Casein kinase substrate phosphoprotein PP28 domain-containing protein n=1 Tax=Drosophila willistoni TaxID=7260 RepID=B4NQ47_DROWI|nr:28 kDa heat- and acid-stable phosphoprotein-like [Drosophila willistoni]EDW86272.1 uncharacterized protein Dwil_GK15983 [Drosophila willistoni]
MPRGRSANHKGRSRQFTPADQLQQDLDENLEMARAQVRGGKPKTDDSYKKSSSSEYEQSPEMNRNKYYKEMKSIRPIGSGVHGLIEVANPNRPCNPNALKRTASQKLNELPVRLDENQLPELRRYERERARGRKELRASQVQADLARLAIIRKEREAAAEKRLNAKREIQEAAALATQSNLSLKKKSPNSEQSHSNENIENERLRCMEIEINLSKISIDNNKNTVRQRRRYTKIQTLHVSPLTNLQESNQSNASLSTQESKNSTKGRKDK